MKGWIWLLVLVVGMTLVQLLVYRRLREDPDGDSSFGERSDGSSLTSHVDLESPHPETTNVDARRCPHCGAENDSESVYTYCASCTRRLR